MSARFCTGRCRDFARIGEGAETMDDHLMYGLREAPPQRLTESLRERLRQQQLADPGPESGSRSRRLAMIAAPVFVVALFALPAVRASAQAFLNLFRVVNFIAVPVNVDRIKQLSESGLDVRSLIGQQVEVLVDPGPKQAFATM